MIEYFSDKFKTIPSDGFEDSHLFKNDWFYSLVWKAPILRKMQDTLTTIIIITTNTLSLTQAV